MIPFRYSSLSVVVLAAAVIVGGWQTASACGNALIYSFLFAKHPEAGIAYRAELTARKDRLYEVAKFPNQAGLSYHKWSFGRASEALERVHERLRHHASAPGSEVSANFMLADEVYVAELSTTSDGPRFTKSFSGGQQGPRIDAYTTVNALIALEDGKLDWQEALERGLVVPARGITKAQLEDVFSKLYVPTKSSG
jgi:hypothetical protein